MILILSILIITNTQSYKFTPFKRKFLMKISDEIKMIRIWNLLVCPEDTCTRESRLRVGATYHNLPKRRENRVTLEIKPHLKNKEKQQQGQDYIVPLYLEAL
jgi:hypothetical protein